MYMPAFKRCAYYLVVLLAVLQALLPLIHAHPAGSLISGVTGLHVHQVDNDAEEFFARDATPVFKTRHLHEQVIGVAGGFEQEDLGMLVPMLYCLFFLAFYDALSARYLASKARIKYPDLALHFRQPTNQTPQSPRAPPHSI